MIAFIWELEHSEVENEIGWFAFKFHIFHMVILMKNTYFEYFIYD